MLLALEISIATILLSASFLLLIIGFKILGKLKLFMRTRITAGVQDGQVIYFVECKQKISGYWGYHQATYCSFDDAIKASKMIKTGLRIGTAIVTNEITPEELRYSIPGFVQNNSREDAAKEMLLKMLNNHSDN